MVGTDRRVLMPSPNFSRSRSLPALALTIALVIAFCLGLWWVNPRVFWNDDYQISILPVLADIARSWHEGHWPLLSRIRGLAGTSPENTSTARSRSS